MVQTRLIELGWSEALDPVWVKDLIKLQVSASGNGEQRNGETMQAMRQDFQPTTTRNDGTHRTGNNGAAEEFRPVHSRSKRTNINF